MSGGRNPNYNYPPPGYPPSQDPYAQPQGYGGYPPAGQYPPPGQYPPGQYGYQGQQPAAFGVQAPPTAAPPRYDDEAAMMDGKYDAAAVAASFAQAKVRKGFAAKVFTIVLIQMIITTAVTCGFVFSPTVSNYLTGPGTWVLWTSYAFVIVFMLVLACGGNIRRKHPWNMILLLCFTVAMSVFVACNASHYKVSEVAMAFGITCGVVLGIVIFAMMPCVDFTMCGGVMVALSFTLLFAIIIGFIVSLTCRTYECFKITNLVIAAVAVFVFSIYLLYDIQLVMGGKRMQLSPDEYILAAMNIYSDIIMLFLYLLQIVGLSNR